MSSEERLITATQELLWERGYVGTSPKAVQQRAGVGQGSMYHHFAGKSELALAAMRRSAAEMRAAAEEQLGAPVSAYDRIAGYLRRERDVLRGCRMGRLTQDPEVITDPALRQPVDEMFRWLQTRLAEVLADGTAAGELTGCEPELTAASLAAVLQGAYVLARAAGSAEPFDRAIEGGLAMLAAFRTDRAVAPTTRTVH